MEALHEIVVMALMLGGILGCLFMIVAALVAPTFADDEQEPPALAEPVTLLKPLHRDETWLFENLATFCEQDYGGPVQIVFGVTDPNDPAIGTVERIKAAYPECDIELVVKPGLIGSNPKVANLINMSARIRHGIVVLADSDIRVEPDYLARVVGALLRSPGGAVTCAYAGIDTGVTWSRFSRLNIDGHFLPGVMLGVRLGFTKPCLGSTIALRRSSLQAIGGFEAVANCLADDFALGQALRDRGEPVTVLPFVVGHVCNESSFLQLWRHELRWALTIRAISLEGYLGWVITHAFPLGLLALAFGGGLPALALTLAALGCRMTVLATIARVCRRPGYPYWLVPVRDLLSFAVFLVGIVARGLEWQGRRFRLVSEGTLASERRLPPT